MRHLGVFFLFSFLVNLALAQGALAATGALPKPTRSPLELASVNAMVVDAHTREVLYANNPDAIVSIASISKLMTAMVVLDSGQPLSELIPVKIDQSPEMKNVFSRIRIGSVVSRETLLLLALMSSENRASAALAHHYKDGYSAFIAAMNAKAKSLGMTNTRFVEPTGLSQHNVSTARDLTLLVQAAADYPLINELSTTPKKDVHFTKPRYTLAFYNTNPLVRNEHWNIQLTKTGFLNVAGRCLVMQTKINKRPVTVVLLDSFGKRSHVGDAGRIKQWLETGKSASVPPAAKAYHQKRVSKI